jgi:hypothetical protein
MRMKSVRNLGEMTLLLDTDLRLRILCFIKPGETDYPRSVLSRFIRKVGEDNLAKNNRGESGQALKTEQRKRRRRRVRRFVQEGLEHAHYPEKERAKVQNIWQNLR